MPLAIAYHRPRSLDEALELLGQPDHVALAGGTVVNADRTPSKLAVVDLQALGLDSIDADGDELRIGAMVTLDQLARDERVPELVRRMARVELPSTLRTLATVGGTVVAGGSESVLLAALVLFDAEIELSRQGRVGLVDLFADGVPDGDVITSVTIETTGEGAYAATGRTPADVPIVAALGRRHNEAVAVVLTGVADVPILVAAADPARGLDPSGDFRGSGEYRAELAAVLTRRVVGELEGGSGS